MKKIALLLTSLVLVACNNTASASSANSGSSIDPTSLESSLSSSLESSGSEALKSSEPVSSSSSSFSSSSSSKPSSSSSSSKPSSSSSSSSSSQGPKPLSPQDALDSLHQKLSLKNSTLVDEAYIEEKMIGDEYLLNHYYGKFAANGDDGYVVYKDQGLFKYTIENDAPVIGDCKSINKETKITDFFYTTYDLALLKNKWTYSGTGYVFTSDAPELSELISELDGQGIYYYAGDTFESKLTISDDCLSAIFETDIYSFEYGQFHMAFTVKDLGTTTDPLVATFEAADRLVSNGEFPEEMKTAINEVTGSNLPAPKNLSYAHTYAYGNNTIIYEDFLAGDQVDDYGSALLTSGYALSDITNVSEDLKNLGYARYYYEKEVGDSIIYIEVYFVPKIQLDEYSKVFYPNGIFHLRIIKTSKTN